MANVGSGSSGNTYIGTGNGKSGTYVPIGTLSGLTDHGVVLAQGEGASGRRFLPSPNVVTRGQNVCCLQDARETP